KPVFSVTESGTARFTGKGASATTPRINDLPAPPSVPAPTSVTLPTGISPSGDAAGPSAAFVAITGEGPSLEDTWVPPGPQLGNVTLSEVDAFNDLPFDVLERLAKDARIEKLGADEEVSGFGAALLVGGD